MVDLDASLDDDAMDSLETPSSSAGLPNSDIHEDAFAFEGVRSGSSDVSKTAEESGVGNGDAVLKTAKESVGGSATEKKSERSVGVADVAEAAAAPDVAVCASGNVNGSPPAKVIDSGWSVTGPFRPSMVDAKTSRSAGSVRMEGVRLFIDMFAVVDAGRLLLFRGPNRRSWCLDMITEL